MKVGVIGCGLIGAAVARELELGGAHVVIFEADGPGRGTSGTTFAWVNSTNKAPREYHDLNVAGIRAHADLQARGAPGPQWFFQTGNLVWPEREDVTTRLERWGYPLRRITPREAHALEPDLRLPNGAERLLLLPDEGYVLPALLLARLLGEALDLGAELRHPARVTHFEAGRAGVRVWLEHGSSELVDAVVICAGRWTSPLLNDHGYALPMVDSSARGSAAVGFLAYTRPTPVRLSRVLTMPHIHVRPDGGGRLVLQALDLDAHAVPDEELAVASPIGRELADRLGTLLRGAERAELEAVRVGRRALPVDGLSVVGRLDDDARVYVVATHSGVTLALVLARLAVAEIAGERTEEVLGPFRPQRFGQPTP
jgi:glycine/D-amino acid oxidase-like deaminating enzyme